MQSEAGWHPEVITPEAAAVLDELQPVLSGRFYLGGGTGLALQLGHRRSFDLDLFHTATFDEEQLLPRIQHLEGFELLGRDRSTLHTHIRSTKVSFLGYPYPLLFPLRRFGALDVAAPPEIGAMKISAIAGRGTRRDFIDVYVLAQGEGLASLLEAFRQKYREAKYSTVHVLKSLTYFEDAEKDPMPDLLVPITWDGVKAFFCAEVPRLA